MNLLDNKTSKMLIKVIPVIIIIALIIQFVLVSASNNPENATNTIGITMEYAPGTEFDTNNDGIESLTGVIDFTVENSEFSWEVNKENLCTGWEVDNGSASTSMCYGNEQCCNFVELEPYLGDWEDEFDLSYGRYGAAYNNTISARIIYVDYNLTLENATSEVYYSDKEILPAKFIEESTDETTINETVEINETVLNETTITVLETIQGDAEIGKPVEWTQTIEVVNNATENKEITINATIPEEAEDIVIIDKEEAFAPNFIHSSIESCLVTMETTITLTPESACFSFLKHSIPSIPGSLRSNRTKSCFSFL